MSIALPAGEAARLRVPALAAIFGLFFLSGWSALVYQTAWQRLLGLFGGADTVASALVVGAFLLGLGLGSLAASLFADRVSRRRALLLFAACELGIAAFAALSVPVFYDLLFGKLVALAQSRALVFALAFAALLWPTLLMGMSLPLLSRAIVLDIAASARLIGWLYAVNTFGAGIGTFMAGWWLIGTFGYQPAILAGAAVNLAVGLGALALARRAPPEAGAALASALGRTPAAVWHWCALVFASGFAIVALQIVWYRLLGVLMQSNAYGFSLVLGTFLVGDALGLLWGGRVALRLAHPRELFLALQALAALTAVATIWLVWAAFDLPAVAGLFVDRDVLEPHPANLAVAFGLTLLVVLPASVMVGFSFPLVQKAVQTDPALVGQRVGLIQLANIAGNSLGGVVTGLVLLHLFGTAGTLRLLALAGCAFALLLWPRRTALALGAALVALAAFFPDAARLWGRLHGLAPAQTGLAAEDRSGVAYLRLDSPGSGRLYIQGHSQSCVPFCTVHGFLGVIGPLVHPAPRDVLIVGVGSGGTPYAAAAHPATERVRAIEIVAPVYDVLRQFVAQGGRAGIDRLLADPRFDLAVGDGRLELFTADRRYDVIEADAILPKTAHSGLLYSAEFFRQMRGQLKPGGIVVQWAPTERTVRTFRAVFPHVALVHPALIGSERPLDVTAERLLRRLADPAIAAHLAAAGLDLAELRQWFEGKKVEALSGPVAGDINSDLHPRDEYYLNRPWR